MIATGTYAKADFCLLYIWRLTEVIPDWPTGWLSTFPLQIFVHALVLLDIWRRYEKNVAAHVVHMRNPSSLSTAWMWRFGMRNLDSEKEDARSLCRLAVGVMLFVNSNMSAIIKLLIYLSSNGGGMLRVNIETILSNCIRREIPCQTVLILLPIPST